MSFDEKLPRPRRRRGDAIRVSPLARGEGEVAHPAEDAARGHELAATEDEGSPASTSSFAKRQKPNMNLVSDQSATGHARHVQVIPTKREFAHRLRPTRTTHKRAPPAHLTAGRLVFGRLV